MKLRHILTLLALTAVTLSVTAQSENKLLRKGNKAYKKDNFNKAEEYYRKALALNADNHRATYNLGCVAMARQAQQGADSIAVDFFVKAAHGQNDKRLKAQAFHNLGIIHQRHENYPSAIDAYKHTLRLTPDDFIARYNLELCKRLLKKQQQQQNQQNNQNRQQQNKKNKDKNNDNNRQNKKQQDNNNGNNNQNKQNNQQPQPSKGQMSKDNAQQMLNAAVQDEKNTQQRMQKARRAQGTGSNRKNW